ncbi:hypothetical protein [Curtobacterium sp. USHLN213]|uniref:hypothetical protein n=1 Tax=Curtobacterium sp. USHLN213 TaxID=3081255 RepID=UPI00301624CB
MIDITELRFRVITRRSGRTFWEVHWPHKVGVIYDKRLVDAIRAWVANNPELVINDRERPRKRRTADKVAELYVDVYRTLKRAGVKPTKENLERTVRLIRTGE